MMIRADPDQPNLIDGTILAYEICEGGVYVTFAGVGDESIIASIDTDDLERLGNLSKAVGEFDSRSSCKDRTRITPRGIEFLRGRLQSSPPEGDIVAASKQETFAFFVEPDVVDCETGTVVAGLGSVGDGPETACVATSSGGSPFGDAFLTRDQLGKLIETLGQIHEAMGMQ